MGFVTARLAGSGEQGGGELRGVEFAGCSRFLGVPYGAPVGGSARFRPPAPAAPWAGVRDALEFGPSAPQSGPFAMAMPPAAQSMLAMLYPRGGSAVEGGPVSEDCLRVNVWTPALDGEPRPVLVWLHGGAFLHGSGNEMAFNGDVLSATEDVVVVTVTHRIGLLGFLGLDALGCDGFDGAGNAGMLDIILALRWVRDNIAAFGGDPSNVTVFGQSGGAMKGATLLAMPAAAGLFHKLIMQSGPALRAASPEAAAAVASQVLTACGLTPETADKLGDVPVAQLLAVQAEVAAQMPPDIRQAMAIGPGRHPVHLPGDLFAAGAPPLGADIPLLIGSATHDMAMMLCGIPGYDTATDEMVAGALTAFSALDGAAVVAQYRALYPAEPSPLLWSRIATDMSFRGGSYEVADAKAAQPAPVYAYLFDQPTDVLGGVLGACHSLDLPYVFGTTRRIPLAGSLESMDGVSAQAVSALIMRTWATFARTGSPAHDGLPAWPAWSVSSGTASSRIAMRLGAESGPIDARAAAPLANL
jgi:para-nitrobenzyl esterase